jgi:hypothetical protein
MNDLEAIVKIFCCWHSEFMKIDLFFVKANKLSSQPASKPKNIIGMPILQKNPKKSRKGPAIFQFLEKVGIHMLI